MGVVMVKLRSAMEEAGMAVAEFPPCEQFTISIIKLAILFNYLRSSYHNIMLEIP